MFRFSVILILWTVIDVVYCKRNYLLFHDTTLYEGSICDLATGGKGVCKVKTNCSNHLGNHREIVICGFAKDEEIICCPNINYTGPYPTLVQACADRARRIEDGLKTDEITERRIREEVDIRGEYWRVSENWSATHEMKIYETCKQEAVDLVLTAEEHESYYKKCTPFYAPSGGGGGAGSPIEATYEHYHMTALGWTSPNGRISWNCGGSLIHPFFVLTAAHCMQNIGTPPDIARVGDIDLNSNRDNKIAVDYTIEKIFVHHEYNSPAYYNDAAILKVKKVESFRYKIRPLPACVWIEEQLPSNILLMMGYGASGFGKNFVEKLYEGNLTVVHNTECAKLYKPVESLPRGITDSQICAGDTNGIFDTCEGDSGGPLQFNSNDKNRTPYIVGITSFGILCLDGNPGVYTKVSSFLEWIERTLTDNYK